MEVRLSKKAVLRFFEEPTLRCHWRELFNNTDIIRNRIYELLNDPILKDCEGVGEFFYNFVRHNFKYYFFVLILNEAIAIAVTDGNKYNVMTNVLELLTEERLKSAVCGEIMIDALADAIREHKPSNPMAAIVNEGAIHLLRKKYIG